MKLKKTLAGALTLCLAMGAAGAMAENTMNGGDTPNTTATTEVKLVINRTLDSYTITIPSNVEIDPRTKKGTGKITLSDENLDLVSCTGLNVVISTAKNPTAKKARDFDPFFTLKDDSTKQTKIYQIKNENSDYVGVGETVLSYKKDTKLTEPLTQTLTYYVESLPTEGTYTDTLTFAVTFSGS